LLISEGLSVSSLIDENICPDIFQDIKNKENSNLVSIINS